MKIDTQMARKVSQKYRPRLVPACLPSGETADTTIALASFLGLLTTTWDEEAEEVAMTAQGIVVRENKKGGNGVWTCCGSK